MAADVDDLINDILRAFAFRPRPSASWKARLRDLRWILGSDYAAAVDRFARAGDLPLVRLEEEARKVFPEFNRQPLQFDDTVERVACHQVQVRMSRYGKAGHPLRGFYHHDSGDRLIWLNVGHVPTAVAATLGHEVGHALWDDVLRPRASGTKPFYNAEFAAHLRDPRELFADVFATVAAYPADAARELFTRRGWPRNFSGLKEKGADGVAAVQQHLSRHYGADLSAASGLPVARRFYYMSSMIHFAKVRAAALHVVGI